MAKILIVEDDPEIAEDLTQILLMELHSVETISDGTDALSLLKMSNFDLIILDWGLPGKTGIEILAEHRAAGHSTPILMLTARDHVDQKEVGLDAGADDYLVKPFHIKELRARVKALLRRSHEYVGNELEYKHLIVDLAGHRVISAARAETLNARELALLCLLLRNQGQVFTLDALIASVWESDADVGYDAVRQCVARLRKKIDMPDQPSIISTIAGSGYKIDRVEA